MNIDLANLRDILEMASDMKIAGAVLETLLASAANIPPSLEKDREIQAINTAAAKGMPARWSDTNSDWPRIGGRRFNAPPSTIFSTAAYRTVYRPGRPRACYVAICDGTEALSRRFRVPLAKTSSCDATRLPERLGNIATEQYGSNYFLGQDPVHQAGFESWRTIEIPKDLILSPDSPVTVTDLALQAALPHSLGVKEFDSRYDELVRLGSLASWVETDAGVLHCQRVGVQPNLGGRFTHRKRKAKGDFEQSLEIVAFRPKMDYPRLAAIIERVILEHLKLI